MFGLASLLNPQQQATGGESVWDRLLDPQVALPAAAAMMQAPTFGDSIGGAFGAMGQGLANRKEQQRQARQRNATLEYFKRNRPDLAAAVEAGMPINDAFSQAFRKQGDGVTYGLNPIYGTDAQGNTVLGTLGNDGSFKPIDTGGFNVSTGFEKIDAGTKWILRDRRSGQIVGEEPKDLRGAEREKEVGTSEGKAAASASGDYQAAQNALDLVDSLETDPNRERGTGRSSILNSVPASRGYDYQNKVEQAKSGAFMTAIQQLRGMGALSNAEGQTATAAVTRMDTATSEEAFLSALRDYRRIIEQGRDRAARTANKFGVELPPEPAAPAAADPLGIRGR